MASSPHRHLTRRERQIMDVIYRRKRATVADVQAELPDPPSYSAVRAMLVKLENKGHLKHLQDGARYIYEPTVPRESARESAVERLLRTFFDGSPSKAVAAILDRSATDLTDRELDDLSRLIDDARKRGQ